MPVRSLIIFGAAALAAPAWAQEPVSDETPAAVPAAPPVSEPGEITITGERPDEKEKKMVCRRSAATGSIMSKRVCRTQADWDRITEKSIADVERMRAERRTRDHVAAMREGSK